MPATDAHDDRRRDVLALLQRLHRHKDAAYGDAWRKRGEVIAIFANMARKYDRLLVAFDEQTPAATEPLGDTVADLCVYSAKYLTWIADEHPEALGDAGLALPDPSQISAARGPDALERVFAAVLAAPDDAPPDAASAWRRVQGSFGVLERGLMAQATPGSTEEVPTYAAKAQLAWALVADTLALLIGLEHDAPGTLDGLRGEVATMEGGQQLVTDTFADQLVDRTLERIIERDARAVAVLGFTPASLAIRGALTAAGLTDRLLGIFDPNPAPDSDVAPLADLAGVPHDLLVIGADADKAQLLDAYRHCIGDRPDPPDAVIAGTAHLAYADPDFAQLNAPALVPSYATGSPYTREHLFQCLQAAAANRLHGAIVEFGAFKGGTTAWLARVAGHLGLDGCRVIGLDSWSGFPARRSVLDLYEHPRCVFTDLEAVRAYTEPLGVELVAGDITETYRQLEGEPLLLCFFDTDNYSPTRAALELCARQLVVGGNIVFDHVATDTDYIDTIGERMAAYEVLPPLGFLHLHGTGVFTKIA